MESGRQEEESRGRGIVIVLGEKDVVVDRRTTVLVILAAQSLFVSFPAELACFDDSRNVEMRLTLPSSESRMTVACWISVHF
jgi:hypothetical protein